MTDPGSDRTKPAEEDEITPLVPEETWAALLDDSSFWNPPAKPLLVVSPHPDDETLGAGGLIAYWCRHGLPVHVIAVTDGEAAFPDWPDLAGVRVEEQQAALALLGVNARNVTRLGLKDGRVGEDADTVVQALRNLAHSNTLLIAPWRGDFHPDHEICGTAAQQVARELGISHASYLFWAWHKGKVEMLDNIPLRRVLLDNDLYRLRERALFCHQSQLRRHGRRTSLPENLLKPAQRRFESYLVWDQF